MSIQRELAKGLATARLRARRVEEALVERFNAEIAKFAEDDDRKLDFAYDVLDKYEAEMHANNWKTIGFKVGATSAAAQAKLKLREPFFGPLLVPGSSSSGSTSRSSQSFVSTGASSSAVSRTKPTLISSHASTATSSSPSFAEETPVRLSISENNVRGVEAEFAFRASRDVTPLPGASSSGYTPEELTTNYFDIVYPIVEVCGSRLPASKAASAEGPLLIADGAGNETMAEHPKARFARPAGSVLQQERALVKIDGKIVASGYGEDVWGSPAQSLAWFVERVVKGRGRTIPKNAIISTGAICGLIPVTKPCYVSVEFMHWGHIHLAFRE